MVRIIVVVLLALCGMMGWAQNDSLAKFHYVDRPLHTESVEYIDSIMCADSLRIPEPEFTAAELNSPMMRTDNTVVERKGVMDFLRGVYDWCVDHLFLSGLLVIVLIVLITWAIYKFCSYFFIARKP